MLLYRNGNNRVKVYSRENLNIVPEYFIHFVSVVLSHTEFTKIIYSYHF